MKTYNASNVRILINGVPFEGFGSITYSADQATHVAVNAYVPFDSVSQAARRRMESDARLRAEERLRDWRRGR